MTAATTATYLAVAGIAVSAMGTLKAGADAKSSADYNASLNAQNAVAARKAGLEKAKREARLGAKRQGANRAMDPDKLDLLEDSAIEEELSIQSIIHGAEMEATGFTNSAALDRARGKNAQSSALIGASGSVLLGGSKVAGGLNGGYGSTGGTASAGMGDTFGEPSGTG